ncbi:embryonic polarity protein dorsal-like isoform X2 [Watersipora subatra]|uniref:embryonic polarity protein dorsal-like isoform X2 n=1 Tax=Watersipora subatra TaxID=2589382 RepID=UPI00355BE7D2
MPAPPNQPYVEIIEEPSAKSTRFRYESENQQGGVLSGATSSKDKQTHPAIKVHNHNGACVVVVSLVTHDDDKPKPHPHTLVGPECRQGVCTKKVKTGLDCIQFPNLGIQCKKKAELKDALSLRQQIRVDPFRTGFDHIEKPQLNNINLMVVKLCFQVFLPDESGKYQRPLPPVCSTAIHDKKSAGELSIHSFLPESCLANGKEEMILLTGRLPKADELEVRFYEGQSDKPEWEGFGTFTQKDIHQSVALTVRIPEYTKALSRSKQQVSIELRKKHTPSERSSPRKFYYLNADSRNRHRPGNKREIEESRLFITHSKRIKPDPTLTNGEQHLGPAVLDDIEVSMETNSSGGSGFGSGYVPNGAGVYNLPPPTQTYQYSGQTTYAPMQVPPNQPIVQMTPQPQPELMRVRASDINIYRNDNSGKVFMAPGPTAANRNAPEVELGEEVFSGAETSIDEILRMTRENPDSEIYIPSNLSEHINMMLNPTVDMLDGDTIQSTPSDSSEQHHTTSLTKELKNIS